MVDTFTPLLRIRLPEVGAKDDQWAPPSSGGLNDGVVDMLDQAIAQVTDVDVGSGNVTLTKGNGVSDNHRPMFIAASGSPGTPRDITVPDPPTQKMYIVENNADDVITLKTVSGTGVDVNPGNRIICYVDSTLDEVFPIEFAGDVVFEAPDWTTGTLDLNNATAGDTQLTYRFSNQGRHILWQLPEFSTTFTLGAPAGSHNLVPNTPATFPAASVPGFNLPWIGWVIAGGVVTPVELSFGFDSVLFLNKLDNTNWPSGAELVVLPTNITFTMNDQTF